MADWVRINRDMLHDPAILRLTAREFRKQFGEALNGARNGFSRHMRPGSDRPPSHEWRALRSTVFARDDYTCTYCGDRGGRLECDHVVPVSRGGSNELTNLTTACRKCNRNKRAKTPAEWKAA